MEESGSAYIFERNVSGNWEEIQKIVANDRAVGDRFGEDVQIGNNYAIIAASHSDLDATGEAFKNDAGAIYIFKKDAEGNWLQQQKIVSSQRTSGDQFGSRLALDDNQLVVSSYYEDEDENGTNALGQAGLIHVYKLNQSGVWEEEVKLSSSDRAAYDRFGYAVAIDNGRILSSAADEDEDEFGMNFMSSSGSVYFFEDLTPCLSTFDTITEMACENYTSPSGTYEWNTSGIYQDTLINLEGCDSIVTVDLTIFQPTEGIDVQAACNEYNWIDGNIYTESNNTAIFTISGGTTNGCDSVIFLDLTINTVNTNTSLDGSTITCEAEGASYQWLDCDNNLNIIPGETNQNFTAYSSRNFAVEITANGCVDTSDCVAIILTSVIQNSIADKFTISPNPTNGSFTIDFNRIRGRLTIRLFSAFGRLIEIYNVLNSDHIDIDIIQPSGLYFIEIEDLKGHKSVLKLINN